MGCANSSITYYEQQDDVNFAGKIIQLCQNGNLDELKSLQKMFPAQMGRCVNMVIGDCGNEFALRFASEHIEIFKFLVKKCKADVNVSSRIGMTPLMCAVRQGKSCLPAIRFLVEETSVDVFQKRQGGIDAFIYACYYNQHEILEYFVVERQIDISRCYSERTGRGCLGTACYRGNTESVEKVLLCPNIDINSICESGFTSLCIATHSGSKVISEILLNAGADFQIAGWNGNTALHFAAFMGMETVTEEVLNKKGSVVDYQNIYGFQPSHLSVISEAPCAKNILKMLLDSGADVNAKTKNGHSLLWLATNQKKHEMSKLLVAHGAETIHRPTNELPDFLHNEQSSLLKSVKFVEFARRRLPEISLANVLFLPKQRFLEAGEIPHFDRCQTQIWHKCAEEVSDHSNVLFVSHRWGSANHPDPEKKQYGSICNFLQGKDEIDYVWVDYSCICQDLESEEFKKHLVNLPTAAWASTHFLILPRIDPVNAVGQKSTVDISNMADYVGRAWCVFEAMCAFFTCSKIFGAYVFDTETIFQPFGSPETGCTSLGFYTAQEKSFELIGEEKKAKLHADTFINMWEFREPCVILSYVANFFEEDLEENDSVISKILTMDVTEDTIGASSHLQEIWKVLGNCFKEEDKAIVFNLVMFVAYYTFKT